MKTINDLLKLMKSFEKRNNISITLSVFADRSALVEEFWREETLFEAKTMSKLSRFLETTSYKLDPDSGRCVYPIVKIKTKVKSKNKQ